LAFEAGVRVGVRVRAGLPRQAFLSFN